MFSEVFCRLKYSHSNAEKHVKNAAPPADWSNFTKRVSHPIVWRLWVFTVFTKWLLVKQNTSRHDRRGHSVHVVGSGTSRV